MRCWGRNNVGQLGDRTFTDSIGAPVDVVGLTDGLMIAAGRDHTCVVRTRGDIVCWGGNAAGQLGDGTTLTRRMPVIVALP